MRCPRCGQENRPTAYICQYCGARLQIERIEEIIPIFRRPEKKWTETKNIQKTYKKLWYVIRNPAEAFWHVNHKSDKKGLWLIITLNAMLFAWMASAVLGRLGISTVGGEAITYLNFYYKILLDFEFWLIFFLFGMIYYAVLSYAWIFLYKMAINFSSGLKKIIKEKEEEELPDEHDEKYPSLVEEGDVKVTEVLGYALAPSVIINAISLLLLLIGLPLISVGDPVDFRTTGDFAQLLESIDVLFQTPLWGALDILQVILLIGWFPLTMTIAIRDVAESETMRIYLACLIMSFVIAYVFVFLRPTLGWNLDLTQRLWG